MAIIFHNSLISGLNIFNYFFKYILSLILGLIISYSAYANPEGGVVAGGSATLKYDINQLDIYQDSNKAIIDWDSFDIDADESTIIHQPSSDSILLNRVTSSTPSAILGNLTANGNVVLLNSNGILFGADSVIDVNNLIATTSGISNENFMAGNLNFTEPGAASSFIINQGSITAQEAGLVALVAPNVVNNGVITAKLGRVELASGNSFSIDLYGDGLYELNVSDEVASQLISNTGRITSEGGVIAITAAAGQSIVNSLINIEGELKAPTIEEKGGKIIISAAGSNSVAGNVEADKGIKSGYSQVIVNDAYLDASGRDAGEQGGEISITGDAIGILGSTVIDASGDASIALQDGADGTATMTADKTVVDEATFLASEYRAGGSIKIGGDYLGGGDTATSLYVYVDGDAYILNDAVTSGDGGRTIIWSDDTTEFYGNVFARGGSEGGNGGFLETSGKQTLSALGYADLTAVDGYSKGTYFLDPDNITIYGNVDPTFVSTDSVIDLNSDLQLWLDSADSSTVTLTYSTDELSSATVMGTSGTNTITTSLDVSANLKVGARIRIGASGTVTTADTLGTDTYTITSISGTSITVQETLTSDYTGTVLNRGLVSSWGDKSDNSYTAATTVEADMPLWIDNGLNGEDSIDFSGGSNNLTLGSDYIYSDTGAGITSFGTLVAASTSSTATEQFWFDFGVYPFRGYGFAHSSDNGVLYTPTGIGGDTTTTNYASSLLDTPVIQTNSIVFGDQQTQSLNGTEIASNPITIAQLNDPQIFQGTTPANNTGPVTIGSIASTRSPGSDGNFSGLINDVIIYDENLSDDATALVEQYQAAKWDIELDSGGTGSTEAEKAMAADGYSVFATDYLERLSATADIILQADDSITLDLQGDTLSLDTDRSITLRTTTGDITDVSSGTITTNQTTTGGNITIDAGGSIDLDTTNLEALNGGVVNLMAVDTIDVSQTSTLTLGTLSSTDDKAITLSSANNISFNTDLTLQETLAASASVDITLNADIATSNATANAIQLSAAGEFINNAGSDALSASNSNWVAYSDAFSSTTRDGLLPDESLFGQADIAAAIASATANNNVFAYNSSTRPTLTYTVEDDTVEYGDALTGTTVNYTSGLEGGDLITTIGNTGEFSLNTSYAAGTNAGTYTDYLKGTVGTLSNVLGYEYAFVEGDLSVTKATVTVTLNDSSPSRFTGESNPTFDLNYSGFKLSDTSVILDSLPTASTLAVFSSEAGDYDISLTGGSDNNYTVSYSNVAGTLTVKAANESEVSEVSYDFKDPFMTMSDDLETNFELTSANAVQENDYLLSATDDGVILIEVALTRGEEKDEKGAKGVQVVESTIMAMLNNPRDSNVGKSISDAVIGLSNTSLIELVDLSGETILNHVLGSAIINNSLNGNVTASVTGLVGTKVNSKSEFNPIIQKNLPKIEKVAASNQSLSVIINQSFFMDVNELKQNEIKINTDSATPISTNKTKVEESGFDNLLSGFGAGGFMFIFTFLVAISSYSIILFKRS